MKKIEEKLKKWTQWTWNDVLTEAKNRIRYVLDKFDKIYISFSWGKDSLVTLKLYEEVLDELWRQDEKINVIFRDEELIPDSVIDFVAEMAKNPRYNFKWFAVPMKSNKFILGQTIEYIQWDPKRKWIREKPKNAIVSDKLYDQYSMDWLQCEWDKWRIWFMTWIRADESLVRLNSVLVKKDEPFIVTSSVQNAKLIKPIYDWREVDIFKYLYERKIPYSKIYDLQYWNWEALRVSTPLHSEASKEFSKIMTRTPKFYQQLVDLFPEMIAQERYWKELDRYSKIREFEPTVDSMVKFINTEIDISMRPLAMERIRQVLAIRQNKMNKWQLHNLWGYPYFYLYKTLINGSFKRAIQAQIKMSPHDIKFEQALCDKIKKWMS